MVFQNSLNSKLLHILGSNMITPPFDETGCPLAGTGYPYHLLDKRGTTTFVELNRYPLCRWLLVVALLDEACVNLHVVLCAWRLDHLQPTMQGLLLVFTTQALVSNWKSTMTYLCLLTVWWRVEGGGIKVVLYNIHLQLMTNHTMRMTRVVIEVNGNLHFSQIRHTEIFEGFI